MELDPASDQTSEPRLSTNESILHCLAPQAPHRISTGNPPGSPLENVVAKLTDVFASSFMECDDRQECITLEQHLACQSVAAGEPICRQWDQGPCLLAVPLQRLGIDSVLTTRCSTDTPHIYEQLALRVLQEIQHQQEMERLQTERQSLIQHVSDHLEELTFLRQITGMIDLPAEQEFPSVAVRILQLANRSIQAQSLHFIDAADEQSCLAAVGSPSRSPETLEWIAQYCHRTRGQTAIVNDLSQIDQRHPVESIGNFLVTRVGSEDTHVGWIIAINRAQGTPPTSTLCEFGSSQATLLQSVADVMASQWVRLKSFAEKEQLMTETVTALVTTVEAKDKYTFGHSERVALYARELAALAGLNGDDQKRVYLAGLLHDIGKIGIPDALLGKPTRLTEDEYEIVKQHAEDGWHMLRSMSHLSHVLDGILHHHENYDGAGYPEGLAGSSIPIDGRILAIADTFDALTSDRPYRSGKQVEDAARILLNGSGTQWDPHLVQLFVSNISVFKQIMDDYQPNFRTSRCATQPHTTFASVATCPRSSQLNEIGHSTDPRR